MKLKKYKVTVTIIQISIIALWSGFFLAQLFKQSISSAKKSTLFLYNGSELPYDTLLAKPGKVNIETSSLRTLYVEINKGTNAINSSFMNEIFSLTVTNTAVRSQYRLNLDILEVNQVSFGKSIDLLEILGRFTAVLRKFGNIQNSYKKMK